MRRRKLHLIVVSLVLGLEALAACKRGPPTPITKPASIPSAPAAFQALFTPDLLGEEIPYFERSAGPAMKVGDAWRVYKVAGCILEVQPDGTKIAAVRLPVTATCDADLSNLTGDYKFSPLSKLTFGKFQTLVGADEAAFGADCITSCGNREYAGMYAWYEGPHVSDELQFVVEADQFSTASQAVVTPWRDALIKAHGESWVEDRGYDCGSAPLKIPAGLRSLSVTSIAVGRGIRLPTAFCTDGVRAQGDLPTPATAGSTTEVVPVNSPDANWYFAAQKVGHCVDIRVVPGVSSPEDLLMSFANDGRPQVVSERKPDRMLIQDAGNPTDPGIVLILGKVNCELSLAMVQEQTQGSR